MNFVINVDEQRVIGYVDDLEYRAESSGWQPVIVQNAPLLHWEYRRDADTGRSFAAIVYELPTVQE